MKINRHIPYSVIFIYSVLIFFCFYTNSLLSQEYTTTTSNSLKGSSIPTDKNWLMGLLNYENDARFTKVSKTYTDKEDLFLEKETYASFIKMYESAMKKGIYLKIISGARNFQNQKNIWENKWDKNSSKKNLIKRHRGKKNKIENNSLLRIKRNLEYSAMPATSRHHWGTDIDIFSVETKDFKHGKGRQIWKWLKNNASSFGFCQVYTKKGKNRFTGYAEEKWHWSYLPLSKKLLNDYLNTVSYEDIKGNTGHSLPFLGSEYAENIKIISNYVNGIDKSCRH